MENTNFDSMLMTILMIKQEIIIKRRSASDLSEVDSPLRNFWT